MSDRELRDALEAAQGRVKELEARVAHLEARLADTLEANAEFGEESDRLNELVRELERPPAPGESRELVRLRAQAQGAQLAQRTLAAKVEQLTAERAQWLEWAKANNLPLPP